jgi:hypothetical protein
MKRLAPLLVLALVLVGCSINRVAANEWGCLFGGGLFEDKGLKKTIAPGSSGGTTSMDERVTVPSDVRYYIIDNDPNTADYGAQPIVVPDVNKIRVGVQVQMRFTFNENVCRWYIEHGKRNQPLNFDVGEPPTGWDTFLNAAFRPFLVDESRVFVAEYDWQDLLTNPEVADGEHVYDVLEGQIADRFARSLNSALGGNYFCGPSYSFDGQVDGEFDCPPLEFTIKQIAPENPQLVQNLEDIQANAQRQEVIASERERTLAQTEADRVTQLATIEKDRDVEIAAADAEVLVQQAEERAALAALPVADARARAEAAFCTILANLPQPVDCGLYKSGNYPQVIGGTALVTPNAAGS